METVIYVLKNDAPAWQEEILATYQGKQSVNIQKVNEVMNPRGYHFHRVAYVDLAVRPDFSKVF